MRTGVTGNPSSWNLRRAPPSVEGIKRSYRDEGVAFPVAPFHYNLLEMSYTKKHSNNSACTLLPPNGFQLNKSAACFVVYFVYFCVFMWLLLCSTARNHDWVTIRVFFVINEFTCRYQSVSHECLMEWNDSPISRWMQPPIARNGSCWISRTAVNTVECNWMIVCVECCEYLIL